MADDWAGDKGRFWAEHADWFSRMLAEFGDAVIEGAALRPGEHVLDVGCGGGDVSLAAAQAVGPTGSVLGVDVSPDELDVATARAAQRDVTNVEFRVVDAGSGDLGPAPVDVLVSRFGVMFFADPVAAFAHLHAAMAPDGRVAFACWQPLPDNDWTWLPALALASVVTLPAPPPPGAPGPFSLSDPEVVRQVLGDAGFLDVTLEGIERPVHLGSSLDEALAFLRQMDWARAALESVSEELGLRADDAMRASIADRVDADGTVDLPGRIWLVRARR